MSYHGYKPGTDVWSQPPGFYGNNGFGMQNLVPTQGSDLSYADMNGMTSTNDFGNTLGNLGNQGDPGMSTWGKLGVAANIIKAGGGIMSGWAQMKNLGIAKNQLLENQRQFDKNFGQAKLASIGRFTSKNNEIGMKKYHIKKTHANPDSSHLKYLTVPT